MKTKLYITILLLAMSLSTAMATTGSDEFRKGPADINVIVDLSRFAPVAPNVADFEDLVPEPAPAYIIAAPFAPKEATFDDEFVPSTTLSKNLLDSLAPVAPKEADFNEDIPVNLAPIAPRTADFDELL